MAKTNVTKYNPMEMLNKAFNFADWATAAITADGTYQETDTTGAREIHIIQTSGTNSVDIKFKMKLVYIQRMTQGLIMNLLLHLEIYPLLQIKCRWMQ